jgi:hypothetical protein
MATARRKPDPAATALYYSALGQQAITPETRAVADQVAAELPALAAEAAADMPALAAGSAADRLTWLIDSDAFLRMLDRGHDDELALWPSDVICALQSARDVLRDLAADHGKPDR